MGWNWCQLFCEEREKPIARVEKRNLIVGSLCITDSVSGPARLEGWHGIQATPPGGPSPSAAKSMEDQERAQYDKASGRPREVAVLMRSSTHTPQTLESAARRSVLSI